MDSRAAALYNRHRDTLPPLENYPLRLRRFLAGERLAAVGEPLDRLCFVVEGCATVHSLMPNGRAALLMEYRGVQTIGELELLTGLPVYSSEVRAVSRGALLAIALPQAGAQLLADPAVLLYLGREVARKLDRSSRLAAQDRLYPLSARLASYLLYAQRGQRGAARPFGLGGAGVDAPLEKHEGAVLAQQIVTLVALLQTMRPQPGDDGR